MLNSRKPNAPRNAEKDEFSTCGLRLSSRFAQLDEISNHTKRALNGTNTEQRTPSTDEGRNFDTISGSLLRIHVAKEMISDKTSDVMSPADRLVSHLLPKFLVQCFDKPFYVKELSYLIASPLCLLRYPLNRFSHKRGLKGWPVERRRSLKRYPYPDVKKPLFVRFLVL